MLEKNYLVNASIVKSIQVPIIPFCHPILYWGHLSFLSFMNKYNDVTVFSLSELSRGHVSYYLHGENILSQKYVCG